MHRKSTNTKLIIVHTVSEVPPMHLNNGLM